MVKIHTNPGIGKMVKWTKGWTVGPTPYQYHVYGSLFFARMRFGASRLLWNRRRRPISRS